MLRTIRELYTGLTRNADGSFSSTKFWQAVVYTVCSWVIIVLTHQGKMSVEYFTLYMLIATGARSLQNYFVNKSSNTKVAAVAAGANVNDVKSASSPTS
jgi:hypothetical protein